MALLFQILKEQGLVLTNHFIESESQDYEAAQFEVNGSHVIYRKAKQTPKKKGQFVTYWKRLKTSVIAPFHESDGFDFYIITVQSDWGEGVFIFPKNVLIDQGIVSTSNKEGKRGFRVHIPFETDLNKQAVKTQAWQRKCYYKVSDVDFKNTLLKLFGN
ncbi:MAG: MepB family protein [Crocinitomicaceae bacterium]